MKRMHIAVLSYLEGRMKHGKEDIKFGSTDASMKCFKRSLWCYNQFNWAVERREKKKRFRAKGTED